MCVTLLERDVSLERCVSCVYVTESVTERCEKVCECEGEKCIVNCISIALVRAVCVREKGVWLMCEGVMSETEPFEYHRPCYLHLQYGLRGPAKNLLKAIGPTSGRPLSLGQGLIVCEVQSHLGSILLSLHLLTAQAGTPMMGDI